MRRKTVDTIPILIDAIKNILSAFSKSRSLPSGLIQRANIILLSSQGMLYWLHSTEKTENPDSFVQKVNEICALYHDAQNLSRDGSHVVSTDEMTGVQALEHKYPDKLPLPGQCAKMEFEYAFFLPFCLIRLILSYLYCKLLRFFYYDTRTL